MPIEVWGVSSTRETRVYRAFYGCVSGFSVQDTDASLADNFIQNEWCNPRDQVIERFSKDCPKPNAKVISPTNHNRNKQRDEPIRIPRNFL